MLGVALFGSPANDAVAQSPAVQLDRTVVVEGETAVLQITNAPAARAHFIRLKPFSDPYTASASDLELRGDNDAVASAGTAVSVTRASDGSAQFSAVVRSDDLSDPGETFGVQLCSSATECSGDALLGEWTLTINEPGATQDDPGEGLIDDDLGGSSLDEVEDGRSVLDFFADDGTYRLQDGDNEIPLRLLSPFGAAAQSAHGAQGAQGAQESANGTELSALAADAGSAYAPPADASDRVATPSNWLVADTGQLYLLVGGVNVLFHTYVSETQIQAIWDQHGIPSERVSAIGELPNAYMVQTVSDVESLQLAAALAAEPSVDSVAPNFFTPPASEPILQLSSYGQFTNLAKARCILTQNPYPDKLSGCLWHLNADGAYRYYGSKPTIDINLSNVWDTTMGAGVTVAIVDRTWEATHEDIRDNVDSARSQLWGGYTGERSDVSSPYHGTAVAGIVGARDNTVGGRGVAPRVSLVNYNSLDSHNSANHAAALTLNMQTIAAYNMSYSGHDTYGLSGGIGLWWNAVTEGTKKGFGGKGSSYVSGVGNGAAASKKGDGWATLDEMNNHPGIIPVCAVTAYGKRAHYSETGPSLWICAPSGGGGPSILAPIGRNHYTSVFSGTSAATPIVSGVVALMRSANADLTWRDVKVILANTAQKNDPNHGGWMSGATKYGSTTDSYAFNYQYGFGTVDAKAAVTAASSWDLLPVMKKTEATTRTVVSLPKSGSEISISLNIQSAIDFTEHVLIAVDTDTVDIRDYRWTLVSPSGTESLLAPQAGCGERGCATGGFFKFASSRHLGENPNGAWTLKVKRYAPDPTNCRNGRDINGYYNSYCQRLSWYDEEIEAVQVVVTGHKSSTAQPLKLTVSPLSLTEGEEVDVSVTLTGTAPTQDLVIPLAFTDETTTAAGTTGGDYASLASITIPAGALTASVKLATTSDDTDEPDETFTIGLGTLPTGYKPAGGAPTVTIVDDDPLPTVTLQTDSPTVTEGEFVWITASLSNPSVEDVALDVSVAPVAPTVAADGSLSPATALSIAAGDTTSTGPVAFTATDDNIHQSSDATPKTFEISATASGGNGVGAPDTITIKIVDDESMPEVSVTAGVGVTEGGDASFTVTASPAPAADLDVSVTVSQSGDYGAATGQQTVTIPSAGSATLTVGTANDDADEADGSVTATLDTPAANAGYTVSSAAGSASVAVADDDVPAPPGYTVDAAVVTQVKALAAQTEHGTAHINRWNRVLVAFGEHDGAGVTGGPMSASEAQQMVSTSNNYVPVWNLVVAELTALEAAAVAQPEISIVAGAGVTEGSDVTFDLTASPAPAADLDVSVAVTVSGDYGVSAASHTVTIPTTGSATLTLSTTNDSTDEADGSVTATVNTGSGYTVSSTQSSGTVTVADDDPTVTSEVKITADGDVDEGDVASFTLVATPAPTAPLPVNVTVATSTHSTFNYGITQGPRTVTIPTTGSVKLSFTATDNNEDHGTVKVKATLKAGSGYTLSSAEFEGLVSINDDDPYILPVASVASGVSGNSIVEGQYAQFVISLDKVPHLALRVGVRVTHSSGYSSWILEDCMWGGTTGFIYKSKSYRCSIKIDDDKNVEADGSISIEILPSGSRWLSYGYTLGTDTTATIPITDNDVKIEGGPNVTEGADATFTVSRGSARTTALTVDLTVADNGDFASSGETGNRQVTILANEKSATFTVGTTDDSADETDGTITATLKDGADYKAGLPHTASVTVADNDPLSTLTTPEVSVSAGSGVTEGSDTTFTITASPAPAADLDVSVTVSQSGDYGATTGQQTVTVPTTGSVTLTVGTTNDGADEADGSVTATLDTPAADAGYTVSATQGAATVSVADDDTPEVGIVGGTGVTEGGDATFTVTASPAPAANLDVSVTVSQSGDYGATTGARTVTIPTTGSVTLTVGTTNDDADEADGSVTATLDTPAADAGYTVSATQGAATVSVADDDDPAPEVSITAGSGVTEGGDATFTITANPAPAANLDVSVTVSQSGDYGATTGARTVTIPTSGSATLTVSTTNDDADEADGSVTATLDTPAADAGYTVSATQGAATVTVADDDDPAPKTGYTVDPQVVANVKVWVAETHNGAEHVNRWQRVLVSFGEIDAAGVSGIPMTATEAQVYADRGWPRWVPVVAELTALEASQQDPLTTPEVSVTAGSGVTEGGDASFTVTASPAPAANLDVSVTVSQSGDYGATTGQRTVTIPTTGSVTLTASTTNDGADEADGSVTATLDTPAADAGYTVSSSQGAATVSVADDDTPEVGIVGGSGITEGGDATFTITASPAPAADLDVSVTVSQSGDYGATTGRQTVTIPTTGSVTLTVVTTNDDADEADGSVTATLDTPAADAGYTVSATQGAGTVSVADDDDPAPKTGYTVDPQVVANVKVWVAETHNGAEHVNRWQRVLVSFGELDAAGVSGIPMTATEAQVYADRGWPRWVPVVAELTALEASGQDLLTTPEVSVTAGSGVTEGGDASFTVTASLAPAADLDVSVTVSQSGDYGATTGQQTVTIPTTGSVTLTVSTTNDGADEADGSVTATLDTPAADAGYTVSATQGAATVSVADDDVPEVSISAGNGVIEGGDVSFTVTASPAPAANLKVSVTVSQSGDYGAATGARTVTIPTTGSVTLTVGTTNDGADEADGSVTATVNSGSGYTVSSSQGAATVSVADDDDPPPPTTPEVSVTAGSGVTEGGDASFTVTASPAPAADLDVSVTVSQSGDYGATTGQQTVTIPTAGSATLTVGTTDDGADEADGSVTATLDTPAADAGYTVSASQGAATVSVADDDVPEVSISAGNGVTEGGDATFTITASPAPASSLDVSVTVSQSGDYGATTGQRTVTISTTGSVTLTVGTTDDGSDEADGSVTATLDTPAADAGYTVSATQGAATVTVADDDDAPGPEDKVSVTVEDASGMEGDVVKFRILLSHALTEKFEVTWLAGPAYHLRDDRAHSRDYQAMSEVMVFAPGVTELTGVVWLNDDSDDEPDEYFAVEAYLPGEWFKPASVGTMTIVDDD